MVAEPHIGIAYSTESDSLSKDHHVPTKTPAKAKEPSSGLVDTFGLHKSAQKATVLLGGWATSHNVRGRQPTPELHVLMLQGLCHCLMSERPLVSLKIVEV